MTEERPDLVDKVVMERSMNVHVHSTVNLSSIEQNQTSHSPFERHRRNLTIDVCNEIHEHRENNIDRYCSVRDNILTKRDKVSFRTKIGEISFTKNQS